MRRIRYFLFALAFLITAVGFTIESYWMIGAALVLSLLLGIWTEKIDNQTDQRFRFLNHKFHSKSGG